MFIVDAIDPVPTEDGYVLPGLKFHESHKVPGEMSLAQTPMTFPVRLRPHLSVMAHL